MNIFLPQGRGLSPMERSSSGDRLGGRGAGERLGSLGGRSRGGGRRGSMNEEARQGGEHYIILPRVLYPLVFAGRLKYLNFWSFSTPIFSHCSNFWNAQCKYDFTYLIITPTFGGG